MEEDPRIKLKEYEYENYCGLVPGEEYILYDTYGKNWYLVVLYGTFEIQDMAPAVVLLVIEGDVSKIYTMKNEDQQDEFVKYEVLWASLMGDLDKMIITNDLSDMALFPYKGSWCADYLI